MDNNDYVKVRGTIIIGITIILIMIGLLILRALRRRWSVSSTEECTSLSISNTPASKKDHFKQKSSSENPQTAKDVKKYSISKSSVVSQPGAVRKRVKKSKKKVSEQMLIDQDGQSSSFQPQTCPIKKISPENNKPFTEINQTISLTSESTFSNNSVERNNHVEKKKDLTADTKQTSVNVDDSSQLNRNISKMSSSSGVTSVPPKRKEIKQYKDVRTAQFNGLVNLEQKKAPTLQPKSSTTGRPLSNKSQDQFPVPELLECQEEGVLFIDNSNIFIEGKKFYAKHQKLRVKADPCFRIDIGKLCQALLNGRRMSYGKLYGSEPPDLDTLWTKIREGGLEVDKFERNYKGEEKEVDNALSSDATAYACEKREKNSFETMLFLAGDRDYCPAVENILRRGWKVEVAAFSFSMSKKMKEIARFNKCLKIVELDQLLVSYEPCPFYVNRQWRPLRTNYTHRQIPRENTKVFSFKREFDVENMSDVLNVKKLADIIATLVRIPCNFYCHRINERKSRTVFIIFLLNRHIVDEGQDSLGQQKMVGVNLEQAWNDCKGLIDKKCKVIFDEYQLDRYEDAVSFIQSMHLIKNTEQMEMSNAFSKLPIEYLPWGSGTHSDESDNGEDMFNDYDPDTNMYELNQFIGNQEAASEDASARYNQFKVVKRKPERIHTTSSVLCKFSFNCLYAQRCKKKHSKLELEYFRHCEQHGLIKKSYYKSKPCYRYIRRNCNTGNTEISPCCPFYHSDEESRCYYCIPFSGEVGHQAKQECAERVGKPYFLSEEFVNNRTA